MAFIQQLIQFLSEWPGSIVYHVLTLLAVQATLGLALWEWRRDRSDKFAERLALASGSIFLARLVVAGVGLLLESPESGIRFLPPLEQAVDAVTVILLVWALVPHLKSLPRLGDVIVLILLLFTGAMYAFFVQDWIGRVDSGLAVSGYNSAPQAAVWAIFQMSLLAVGSLLVVGGRQARWPLRLVILLTLMTAHFVQFWNSPETVVTETDAAYWVRLGNLFAFPLLAALAYRHNLFALLSERSTVDTPAEKLSQHLHLARQVIDSLDFNRTLLQAMAFASEVTQAPFAALAVMTRDEHDHLYLVGRRTVANEETPPEEQNDAADQTDRIQRWALKLGDWPAIRLAMQQRQRVELIPNGLGARQLYDFYSELGLSGFGSLLIEPLLADNEELGVLLLAGPPDRERWTPTSRVLSSTVGAYLAQAILNVWRHQQAWQEASSVTMPDEELVSGRIIALEQERDRALTEMSVLRNRLHQMEERLMSESQRSRSLASTLTELEQFNNDERSQAMEEEIRALRESLLEAEEAVALAAAGEEDLDAEWVTLALTRYSGELEEAQARIKQLEARLASQESLNTTTRITTLAQELRSPLTSLAGYTDVLLNEYVGILGTDQLALVRRVKSNIEQLSRVLEQLFRLTEAGPRPLDVDAVDVNEAIEKAVDAVGSQLREKNLYLDLTIDDDLPPVFSDGDGFHQIVRHLLANACQVSGPDGRVAVKAFSETVDEPSANGHSESLSFLRLTVSDEGRGASRGPNGTLLNGYSQPDEKELERLPTFGPALSTAAILIAAHGGRIWVDGSSGSSGSRLSVLLPIADGREARVTNNGRR